MNQGPHPDPIELAHEEAFSLGDMQVRPATLEVCGPGWREVLEPRVMQVLVVLARARGAVVSRDDLIQACWGGRAVGEDAINRCIARLRRLARTRGGFELATVPRVGYRLTERKTPMPQFLRSASHLRTIGLVAVVSAILGAVWLWASSHNAREPPTRVSVAQFQVLGDEREGAELAAGLADRTAGLLGESGADVTAALDESGAVARRSADLVIGGTVARDGDLWRVRAFLKDARADFVIWTEDFDRPAEQSEGLRDEVATAAAETVYVVLEANRQKDLRLDPQTLALFVRGTQAMKTHGILREAISLRAFEQIVERVPDFADGRAHLAMSLQWEAAAAPPERKPELYRRARAEARRAIERYPTTSGAAFDALYFLERQEVPGDIARAEDQLLRGLAAAPEFPFVHMRECRLLLSVGRTREALTFCQRANSLRPLAPPPAHSLVRALLWNGELEAAHELAVTSTRLHPHHGAVLRSRFEMDAFTASPDDASAFLHSPEAAPMLLSAEGVAAFDLFLAARRSRSEADDDTAMEAMWAAARAGRLDPRYLVMAAATLGRVDEAFAALAAPGMEVASDVDDGCLFEPSTEPLRQDPRFWKIAARVGLIDYWRARNRWPDFCSDMSNTLNCKAQASQAAAAAEL